MRKRNCRKRLQKKENGFITYQPFTLADELCHKITDSSIGQEIFSSVPKFLSCDGQKTLLKEFEKLKYSVSAGSATASNLTAKYKMQYQIL